MNCYGGRAPRTVRVIALALAWSLCGIAAAACDFPIVKKQIDEVLDQDKQKSAEFRRLMTSGYDSLDVLNRLVPDPMRDKLDACRFEAGEYLTKRGFPPSH